MDYVEEPAVVGDVAGRIHGSDACRGGVDGEMTWQGLAVMGADGGAYVSMSRFTGTVDGATGSFLMRITGTIGADGSSEANCVVLEGSGTGALAGLRGTGLLTSKGDSSEITLDYAIG